MFLRHVTNAQGVDTERAKGLLKAHPLVITSWIESYWRNHYKELPIIAWHERVTNRIFDDFGAPRQAGELFHVPAQRAWDHLIYAYLIENTRIYDIFMKVLQTCRTGEKLGRPNARSERFWFNTDALMFSSPPPTSVWNVTSRVCSDEVSQRMSTYWSALGLELSHAGAIAQAHPYEKPGAANVEFIGTFENFARMVWRGIVNVRNTSGPKDTDNQAIAALAQRMHHMFDARRQNGNFLREEFRAVAVMSWLHLAVSFNSPMVKALNANAPSCEERLCNIAEQVGMKPHPNSGALFALAQPFSRLLRWIEEGTFDDIVGAEMLYTEDVRRPIAEVVIGEYSLAMGRDLKAMPVAISPPVSTPERPSLPRPALVPAGR